MYVRLLSVFFIFLLSCKDEIKKDELSVIDNNKVTESNYDLEVYDFKGFEKFLNQSDDKVYVVNFWATWCAPCIKELPYFEALNESYSNKNVEVLLVSLDFPKNYEKKLVPYIEKEHLKSKVIALNDPDANSWIQKVNEDWSGAIPATLIYSKNKRQFYEKSFSYDELKTEVEQFLN